MSAVECIDVVHVRVYVDGYDESDLVTIHEVRDDCFEKDHDPVSTLVEVNSLAIEELQIEFDADAFVPRDGWDVTTRNRSRGQPPVGGHEPCSSARSRSITSNVSLGSYCRFSRFHVFSSPLL